MIQTVDEDDEEDPIELANIASRAEIVETQKEINGKLQLKLSKLKKQLVEISNDVILHPAKRIYSKLKQTAKKGSINSYFQPSFDSMDMEVEHKSMDHDDNNDSILKSTNVAYNNGPMLEVEITKQQVKWFNQI
jgi:hypothetical protein